MVKMNRGPDERDYHRLNLSPPLAHTTSSRIPQIQREVVLVPQRPRPVEAQREAPQYLRHAHDGLRQAEARPEAAARTGAERQKGEGRIRAAPLRVEPALGPELVRVNTPAPGGAVRPTKGTGGYSRSVSRATATW